MRRYLAAVFCCLFVLVLADPLLAQKEDTVCLDSSASYVGTLVALYAGEPSQQPNFRFENPGAPSHVSCSDVFDPSHCRSIPCGPVDAWSLGCLEPLVTDCYAVIVRGGSIVFISHVAEGECPSPN